MQLCLDDKLFSNPFKCLTHFADFFPLVISMRPNDLWRLSSIFDVFRLSLCVIVWYGAHFSVFVKSLFCLLCMLISKSSIVSSDILIYFLFNGVVILLDSFTDPFRFWIWINFALNLTLCSALLWSLLDDPLFLFKIW